MIALGKSVWIACAFMFAMAQLLVADNFSTGMQEAKRFGVHEVELRGAAGATNPFDLAVEVRFTPPSGPNHAIQVSAFYDGADTWRARLYVSEAGEWSWVSVCESSADLDGRSGHFKSVAAPLPGRLRIHPNNPVQWAREDGNWFLNLSDTAYFLLSQYDGNGKEILDADVNRYVQEDQALGITSLRCFLTNSQAGFSESNAQWLNWFFADGDLDRLRLDGLQVADHRLQLLLNEYPQIAVQLILLPLAGYNRDDSFWTELSLARRERLLRQLVARFAAFPQLFWLVQNDAHYGEKFPNNNALAREVGVYLQQHDPWQHPRSTGHARMIPFQFSREDWVSYIHIEHAHDLGAKQIEQYREFRKPVFLGEDRYEQDRGQKVDPQQMQYWQRRLYWSWLLAGGSANYGGRWWTLQPYSQTGKLSAAYHKRSSDVFSAPLTGLNSVRVIRDFFSDRAIELSDFVPDSSLLVDMESFAAARQPKLMRNGWRELIVYHPHAIEDGAAARIDPTQPARLKLDLTRFDGPLRMEWIRAADGLAQYGGSVESSKIVELVSPWVGQDVVVKLWGGSSE